LVSVIDDVSEYKQCSYYFHYYCPKFVEILKKWQSWKNGFLFSDFFKYTEETGEMPLNKHLKHVIIWTGSQYVEEPIEYYSEYHNMLKRQKKKVEHYLL